MDSRLRKDAFRQGSSGGDECIEWVEGALSPSQDCSSTNCLKQERTER